MVHYFYFLQLTVIHPQSPTKAPQSQQKSTEHPLRETNPVSAEAASEKPPRPAHAQLSPHHVDMQPQTIVDHYLESSMSERTQAIAAGGSKFTV